MRTLMIAVIVLGIAGCSSTPVVEDVKETPTPRISTSPGPIPMMEEDVRPFTELPQTAGVERRLDSKLYELNSQLEEVDRKRSELNQLVIESENAYRPLLRDGTDQQVLEYQEAQRTHQAEIARMSAELDLKNAQVQNELDALLAKLEAEYEVAEAQLRAKLRYQKTKAMTNARTQQAKLKARSGMDQAGTVEPVMIDGYTHNPSPASSSGLYYLDRLEEQRRKEREETEEQSEQKAPPAPAVTQRIESPPGTSSPDHLEELAPPYSEKVKVEYYSTPQKRIKYDAVLVYEDKESREMWFGYLNAYGVKDLFRSDNAELGEYFIYLGTYSDSSNASQRIEEVADTIGTTVNSRVVVRDLTRTGPLR